MTALFRFGAWIAVGLAGTAVVCAAAASSAGTPVDWERVGNEATELLSRYLRVDTSNPPGNERAAAEFLRGVFEREGLPVTVWEPAPGKANIITHLAGNGRRRPIILLHHMDVVPAARKYWTVDPFAGEVKDGYIWGRGALDMKGMGIAEIVATLTLHREGIVLDRDVILLATSDEEIGGVLGAGEVARNQREALRNAEFVLNEGGNIIVDATGRALSYSVLAAEKTPFWLEVVAHGTPGHGSVQREDTAPNRLVRALEKIRTWSPPLTVTPVVERYFRAMAPTLGPELQPLYVDLRRAIADPAARELLAKNPRHYALLRNTISITVLEGSSKTNVIPPVARAELDVRLLPGKDPQAFLAEIRQVAGEKDVEIKPLGIGWPAPESTLDSDLFRAITKIANRRDPGVPVVPLVSTGFTDCHYFMELGMTCYGFAPFRVTEQDWLRIHGNDERLSIESLRNGVRFLHDLLLKLGRGAP